MSTAEVLPFAFKGHPCMIPEDFVTKKHPGGKATLLPLVGRDITKAFENADHSADAMEMLEEWCVDLPPQVQTEVQKRAETRRAEEERWRWTSTVIAFSVAAVVAAVVLRKSS